MGCDWYSIYKCKGEGVLIFHNGNMDSFIKLHKKNGADIKKLPYKMSTLSYRDSVVVFYGNIKGKKVLSMPGPYEIEYDYMFYEKDKNAEDINADEYKSLARIEGCNYEVGCFDIFTTCYYTNIYDCCYSHNEPKNDHKSDSDNESKNDHKSDSDNESGSNYEDHSGE